MTFFAASPLVATRSVVSTSAAMSVSAPGQASAQSYDVLCGPRRARGPDGITTTPGDALDVFEFEPGAKNAVLGQGAPAHWGYLESGVDGDVTRDANHTAYTRDIDARKLDASVKIFDATWRSLIFIGPVGSLGAYDGPQAGVAVARAAGKRKHRMILSTVDKPSVADVNKARGAPAWFMRYPTDDWAVTHALVSRAEAAGSPAIVLTVDRQGGRNTEDLFRERRQDQREITVCHTPDFANEVSRKANFFAIDVSKVTNLYGAGMTWDFVDRLCGIVKGMLLLKGIMAGENAAQALRHGEDGIVVSNHGGRAEGAPRRRRRQSARPEGDGCRRRPILRMGLACFGESGVDRVLQILDNEFILRQAGALGLTPDRPVKDELAFD